MLGVKLLQPGDRQAVLDLEILFILRGVSEALINSFGESSDDEIDYSGVTLVVPPLMYLNLPGPQDSWLKPPEASLLVLLLTGVLAVYRVLY